MPLPIPFWSGISAYQALADKGKKDAFSRHRLCGTDRRWCVTSGTLGAQGGAAFRGLYRRFRMGLEAMMPKLLGAQGQGP
jgi:hypothetical protein